MKNLFHAATADEMKARIGQLRSNTPALWGKMSAPQMVEHCARGMAWAVGDAMPPRLALPLRILGRVIKSLALGDDKPMRRNSPTAPALVVKGEPEMVAGREKLCALIDRFVAGGHAGCTAHPHSFFGKMTPAEWGVLVYKHTDHPIRQFRV